MSQPPRLGIVVVNYGSHELLARNLTRLDLDAVPACVAVVDNFQSLRERAALRKLVADQGWHCVERADNAGFGAASNDGVNLVLAQGCTAVLLLNPDVSLETAVVRSLFDACTADPAALVSPVVHRPDGSIWSAGGFLSWRDGTTRTRPGTRLEQDTGWLTGACLAMSSELWRQVGGFDPAYVLYWEDVDLSRRCVDAGARLVMRQDLAVVHDVGGTQPGAVKSTLYLYYNCRNRLLFAAKHLGRRDLLRWLAATPRASWRILSRDGRRGLVRRPAAVASAVRGSVAGAVIAVTALVGGMIQSRRCTTGS